MGFVRKIRSILHLEQTMSYDLSHKTRTKASETHTVHKLFFYACNAEMHKHLHLMHDDGEPFSSSAPRPILVY